MKPTLTKLCENIIATVDETSKPSRLKLDSYARASLTKLLEELQTAKLQDPPTKEKSSFSLFGSKSSGRRNTLAPIPHHHCK
jgi:hypothetical protein